MRWLKRMVKVFRVLLLALCFLGIPLVTSGRAMRPARPVAPAATIINSDITSDTTWTLANSPYHITASFDIASGVTLTIEPGVEVWFLGKFTIDVLPGASIVAKGTPSQHITIGRYPGSLRWKKIWFHENTTSYLRYVDIAGGGSAVSDDDTLLHFQGAGTHVVNMCTFADSKQQGIVASGSSLDVTVAGTLFQLDGRYPIMADSGANVTVTGCTFNAGSAYAIFLRQRPTPPTISVANSNLLSNAPYEAIHNEMPGTVCVDAQNNWWGASNGPFDASSASDACGLGSRGGGGSYVTDGVDYRNWRTSQVSRVGITTDPEASFSVTPDPTVGRPIGTVYTFDASGSTDVEDYTSSLDVCWDWDNDGTCETSWSATKTVTHAFASGGLKEVRLRVRDTDNDVGETVQALISGYPPTATFVITQPAWSQAVFDASASSDVETAQAQLLAGWDWEGDGAWDTTGVSTTQVQTHTYAHLGRYWPALLVEDTDGLTDTVRHGLDVIPPWATTTISGSGGVLVSVDGTVHVAVYTATVGGEVISDGLVITHTPWLTVPQGVLGGYFTYQGFNLEALSLGDGQPLGEVSGTYTVAVGYDRGYLADVLRLTPLSAFEDRLMLYRWSAADSSWVPVTSTVETATQQVAAVTGFFGDFALVWDVRKVYLPLAMK